MPCEFYRYRPLLRFPTWSLFPRSLSCKYDHHYNLQSIQSIKAQNAEKKVFEKFYLENRKEIRKAAVTIGRCIAKEVPVAAAVDTCGPYEYYGSSCESEHDNAIFRRLRTGHKNNVRQESLVLDIDQLFKEIPNMVALGRIKPSLDHNLIAIIVELKSSETKSDTSSTGTAVLYLKDIDQNLISKIDISEILQSSIYGPAQQATLCPSIIDVEWAVDTSGRTLLYLVLDDELHRPSLVVVLDIGQLKVKLFEHNTRHKGGSARIFKVFSPSRDDFKFVAREDDVAYNIDVGRSKDDKFVIISSHSKVSSEVSIIPIPAPLDGLYSFARPLTIRSRQRGLKYYVDHCGHYFYVATNKPRSHGEQETMISPVLPELGVSSDLSIIRCASSTVIEYSINNETSFRSWTSVYPPKIHDTNNEASKSSVVVNDFDIFLEKMVVYGRVDGFPSVRILDLARQLFSADMTREDIPVVDLTQQIRDVVGSKMFFIRVGMNSFDSSAALFSVSNPIMPEIHFKINLKTGELARNNMVYAEGGDEMAPSVEGRMYRVFTEMALSRDGTSVPVTIVEKRTGDDDITPTPGPFVLIGYGAYGIPISMEFDPQVMTLLQRGFSVGYAHCRGGGEYGSHWHASGKGMLKWNTFHDFVACAEHLILRRYTAPSFLCGMGTSAGGLIMGVMVNKFPDLFTALIMRHPFLDPYETLQRPELPLTVHEYDEYGNPNDPQAIKNIQSYSPCSNVQGGHRPAMFLSTGLQDTRVGPWEAFKWTGMMRDLSPTVCRQSVILQVTPDCGHNGPSDIMEDNLIKAAEIVFLEKSILKSNSMTGTALKKGSGG